MPSRPHNGTASQRLKYIEIASPSPGKHYTFLFRRLSLSLVREKSTLMAHFHVLRNEQDEENTTTKRERPWCVKCQAASGTGGTQLP